MSISKMRKKAQQKSAPAKAFRRPATRGGLVGFSLLSLVAVAGAIWVFLAGNELAAMAVLAVGVVLGAIGYDNWRRLRS